MSVRKLSRKNTPQQRILEKQIYHNNKRTYEFLFIVEPTDNKKEKKELAQTIQRQRAEELQAKGTSYVPKHKRNIYLTDYFENYKSEYDKADIRMIEGAITKFEEFISIFLFSQIEKISSYGILFLFFQLATVPLAKFRYFVNSISVLKFNFSFNLSIIIFIK